MPTESDKGQANIKGQQQTSDASDVSSDSVSLNDMAKHLQSLEKKLAAKPDIDQEHVNRIRDAITSGEYRIDPQSVAEKLLNADKDDP